MEYLKDLVGGKYIILATKKSGGFIFSKPLELGVAVKIKEMAEKAILTDKNNNSFSYITERITKLKAFSKLIASLEEDDVDEIHVFKLESIEDMKVSSANN
jgi:hypothetical protein